LKLPVKRLKAHH